MGEGEIDAVLKWDGHTHTQFCPHGKPNDMTEYVERAIKLGFQRYSITEHSPLPAGWLADPELQKELAMDRSEVLAYFQAVKRCKEQYGEQIEVLAGMEFDYLHGQTNYTMELLDEWQHEIEDIVFSVHYLPGKGGMRCIDFTPQDFKEHLIAYYGTIENVVEQYYDHVEQAIHFASRLPGRRRLGHINLIEKFSKALPAIDPGQIDERLQRLLPKLISSGIGLDVNTAGTRLDTFGKAYVPEWFLKQSLAAGVECIFGSDAHHPDHVGHQWDGYQQMIR